jgi:hypothetical protein
VRVAHSFPWHSGERLVANNWPDGGEQPLSKIEKWIVGVVAVIMVTGGLGFVALMAVSALKLTPSPLVLLAVIAGALALALFWIRPWSQEPPRALPRARRRP